MKGLVDQSFYHLCFYSLTSSCKVAYHCATLTIMTLDELITIYRECGPVVAKLSLPTDYNYMFADICNIEPKLLEIFVIDADTWVYLMSKHPEFFHLCNTKLFSLVNWLRLLNDVPKLIDHVDLFSYPHKEYQNDKCQYLLHSLAYSLVETPYKVPLKYLNAINTSQILKYYPNLVNCFDPFMVASIQNSLDTTDIVPVIL